MICFHNEEYPIDLEFTNIYIEYYIYFSITGLGELLLTACVSATYFVLQLRLQMHTQQARQPAPPQNCERQSRAWQWRWAHKLSEYLQSFENIINKVNLCMCLEYGKSYRYSSYVSFFTPHQNTQEGHNKSQSPRDKGSQSLDICGMWWRPLVQVTMYARQTLPEGPGVSYIATSGTPGTVCIALFYAKYRAVKVFLLAPTWTDSQMLRRGPLLPRVGQLVERKI